jgi:co-chaperonin GroES (HSP10)
MKPLPIRTEHAEYEAAELGKGEKIPIRPFGDQVLVLGDLVIRQKGPLTVMTDKEGDRLDRAAITGTVLAVGPDAWSYNSTGTKPFVGDKPKPGMRVTFTRYSGQATHLNGKVFFLMSDQAIGGELLG